MRVVTSNPAASAASKSRPDRLSRSAIARAGGTTSGVTWVNVARWASHIVTAVIRNAFRTVAPVSDARAPPMMLVSAPGAKAVAKAATWGVSSPAWPATAQASASSNRFLHCTRTLSGIASTSSVAAYAASTWVASSAIVVLHRIGARTD